LSDPPCIADRVRRPDARQQLHVHAEPPEHELNERFADVPDAGENKGDHLKSEHQREDARSLPQDIAMNRVAGRFNVSLPPR
jgi:hypothetical protein